MRREEKTRSIEEMKLTVRGAFESQFCFYVETVRCMNTYSTAREWKIILDEIERLISRIRGMVFAYRRLGLIDNNDYNRLNKYLLYMQKAADNHYYMLMEGGIKA